MNPTQTRAPQTSIVGLWQDSADRIWVVGNTVDLQWRRAEWDESRAHGVLVRRPAETDSLLDGFIEVIDAQTGAVRAARRFEQSFAGVASAGYIYSTRQDGDGFRQVTVARVQLVAR
jgi:hypothetical protein